MNDKQMTTVQAESSGSNSDYTIRMDKVYVSKHHQPYISPTPGELPLIAIGINQYSQNGMYKVIDKNGKEKEVFGKDIDKRYFDEVYLEKIKECGFNAVEEEIGRKDKMKLSIENCEKAGVKQMVRISQFSKHMLNCSGSNANTEDEIKNHLKETADSPQEKNGVTDNGIDNRVRISDLCSSWLKNVKVTKESESCGAYQLDDEPIMRMYPWYAKVKDIILNQDAEGVANVMEYIKNSYDPKNAIQYETDSLDTLTYINLLPLYVEDNESNDSGDTIQKTTGCNKRNYISSEGNLLTVTSAKGKLYQVYLDEFGKIFKPGVWCLDDYYLREGTLSMYPGLQPRYFESLDAIRKKALQEDRPFWATVRCKYHSASGENTYFMPERYASLIGATMNIEARTALAYGAKGLMFWTIQADPETSGDMTWAPLWFDFKSNVGSSPETKAALVETNAYPYLQNLLGDIKRHENLFLNSTVKVTAITKGSNDSVNHPESTENHRPVCLGNRIYHIESNSSFCLARHNTPDGGFLVCVNLDLKYSQNISIWYNKKIVTAFDSYGSVLADKPTDNSPFELVIPDDAEGRTFNVEPGGWRILKW